MFYKINLGRWGNAYHHTSFLNLLMLNIWNKQIIMQIHKDIQCNSQPEKFSHSLTSKKFVCASSWMCVGLSMCECVWGANVVFECACVCVHLKMYVRICVDASVGLCTYTYKRTCNYIYVCIYKYTCTYNTRVWVCTRACVCLFMYTHICLFVYTRAHIFAHTNTVAHMRARVSIQKLTLISKKFDVTISTSYSWTLHYVHVSIFSYADIAHAHTLHLYIGLFINKYCACTLNTHSPHSHTHTHTHRQSYSIHAYIHTSYAYIVFLALRILVWMLGKAFFQIWLIPTWGFYQELLVVRYETCNGCTLWNM